MMGRAPASRCRPPTTQPAPCPRCTSSSRPAAFWRARRCLMSTAPANLRWPKPSSGPWRAPPPDRRGRHRHRQDPGLPAARPAHRPARHRLHRHQGPAGSALLPRHSLPRNAARRAARLLHEGPRQLPVPPQAGRAAQPADSQSGLEEIDQYRQIAEWEQTTETGDRAEIDRHARVERPVAKAGCAHRGLPGVNLSRLPPLLHHRDAAQGARIGHHHRQPPPVFRRPEPSSARPPARPTRAFCPRPRRWSSTRRTSWKTWLRATSAFRSATSALRSWPATPTRSAARQGRRGPPARPHSATPRPRPHVLCRTAHEPATAASPSPAAKSFWKPPGDLIHGRPRHAARLEAEMDG
jgi:hypothetical protein